MPASLVHAIQLAGLVIVSHAGVVPAQAGSPPHMHTPVVSAIAQVVATATLHMVGAAVSHWHSLPPALQRGFRAVQPECGSMSVPARPPAVLEHIEQEPSTWHFCPFGQLPSLVPSPGSPSTLQEIHVPRVASRDTI